MISAAEYSYSSVGSPNIKETIRTTSRILISLFIVGWSFLFGIILFSGSLYILAITGIKPLGMITPIGGILFIIGWVLLVLKV